MTDDEVKANLRPHGNVRRIGPVDPVSVKCELGRHDECAGTRLRWTTPVASFATCLCSCHTPEEEAA